MSRRTLIPLVALIAVLAMGVAWLVRNGVTGPEREATQQALDAYASPNSAPPGSVNLTAPEKGAIGETRSEPSKSGIVSPSSEGRSSAAIAQSERELKDAIWVEGRVIIPEGTPPDEHVEILADGNRFASRPLYHAPIDPDGHFRVAFAQGTETGLISLQARYLYLDPGRVFHAAKPPKDLVLKPTLGGCIRGRVILPTDGSAPLESVRACKVEVSGDFDSLGTRSPGPFERKVGLSEDLGFELDGIPPEYVYRISIRPQGALGTQRDNLEVQPGRILQLDLQILQGARVAGRVVDEDGVPVPDVRIEAFTRNVEALAATHAGVVTASDGAFSLAGIHPGKVALSADGPDSRTSVLELGDLPDGTSREGVELVLKRRLPISGRVVWADGRPAVGCTVAYTHEDFSAWGKSFGSGEVETENDGRFQITDVGIAPISLTARMKPTLTRQNRSGSGSGTKVQLNQSPWVAFLDGVEAGTDNVVLTLGPGVSIQGRVLDEAGRPIPTFSVRADPVRTHEDMFVSDGPRCMSTGSNGAFELVGLRAGSWQLTANAPGYADAPRRAFTIPGDGTPIDLILRRPATLSGVVVDASGRPVSSAKVSVGTRDPLSPGAYSFSSSNEDRTDADGRFNITKVSPGSLVVTASSRGWSDSEWMPIEVQSGQVVSGLTITLRPAREPAESK